MSSARRRLAAGAVAPYVGTTSMVIFLAALSAITMSQHVLAVFRPERARRLGTPSSLGALLLAVATALTCAACTKTETSLIESPVGSRISLSPPDGHAAASGTWALTEGDQVVAGSLAWSTDCRGERYTTFAKILVTTVTALGEQGSLWDAVMNVGVTKKEVGREERNTEHLSNQICGSVPLAGVELALRAAGLPDVVATTDGQGGARFALPADATMQSGEFADVVVRSSPPALASAVPAGMLAGRVALGPYNARVAARQGQRAEEAAVREADAQVFSGSVHGDALAKKGFTFDCHPDGADVCFDAIDNDCDGLYDVGCGYQSGALQWTLAWRTGDDLDLHLIGPDGAHVFFRNKKGGAAGLVLDVDCLGSFGNNCLAQNVENIFTPRDKKPMEGTYRGWVEVFNAVAGDAGRTVEAMLGGRLAGKTYRMPMTLQAQRGVRIFFAFAIGPDRDSDSVIDREDACPDTAGVFSAFAAENGCPDSDLDGIADSVDQCPHEVGLRLPPPSGRKGWSIGCPKKYGKALLSDRGVEITEDILFPSGSAVIEPRSYGVLHDIADAIRDAPDRLPAIVIMGHTDSDGDALDNRKLSIKRAESVRDYLLKKEHVPAKNGRGGDRFWTQGYGEDRPKVDNDTPAHKQLNRRVVFEVFDPQAARGQSW